MEEHRLKLAECIASGDLNFLSFRASPREIFLFFRLKAIKTMEHLFISHDVSEKIIKSTRFRDPGTLMMLLLSGKDQIRDAIETIGIRKGERNFVIAYSNSDDIERFRDEFGSSVEIKVPHMEERDISYDQEFFSSLIHVILSVT